MIDEEARALVARDVSRGTLARLEAYVQLVREAGGTQNLIAPSTFAEIWHRHVLDSLQLLRHAPSGRSAWADVGSGAGFPGLVIAMASDASVTLIDSRRLRTTFLAHVVDQLALSNVEIMTSMVERVELPPVNIISARAVAALPKLFTAARHLADDRTTWLLPKGRSASSELAEARRTWQGEFIMQPSITDPDAAIIVARNVSPHAIRSKEGRR